MRSVKVNKDVFTYRETIFFGLTMRQFLCALLAMGTAVGLYFLCKDALGKEITSWVCILGAAPFAFLGFFKFNGLTAEEFALAWFKTNILSAKVRIYSADNYLYDILYNMKLEDWSDTEDEEISSKAQKLNARKKKRSA